MQNFKQPWGILFIYSSLIAVSSALVLGGIMFSPSEAERAVAFGLSTPRLVIALGLLSTFILFAWLALKAFRDQAWAERFIETWFGGKGFSQWTSWLSAISFGLGWIGCFLPAYRLGVWSNYWERIQPVMVFVLIMSLATLIVLFTERIQNLNIAILKWGLPLFVVCLVVVGGMFYTGFGVVASAEDFWYGTGVPILVSQLLVAILGGVFFLHFGSSWASKRADILICILIFAFTAFLWARAPLRRSFLFTAPTQPDQVYYPFADAALFDTASQFALIGQKLFIFNTQFFERPLYLSFLVYLHSILGQDFELLTAVQAGMFAILPALIYLIGRSLHMRAVGFASAIAITFRGLNSIAASNLLDTANPKMILTDFPTAIGLALITLLLCEWLKDPEKKRQYPAWIGGAIGFALMLRTNALILLAFMPLYALFIFGGKWKRWILSSLLMLLGAISITLPWEIRNQMLGGEMYGPIVTKFRSVIQSRYQGPGSFLPQEPRLASMTLHSAKIISSLYPRKDAPPNSPICANVICFSTTHFLHNVLTSVLTFPTSPLLDDLRYLIKGRHPYWQAVWDGHLAGPALFLLALNLFLITTGIALAWREKRLIGLVPLAIFVAYNISNGLARTSGGRYLVPADWILYFYYLLGVLHIIAWCANAVGKQWNIFTAVSESRNLHSSNMWSVFIALLMFGSLLPLSENLYLPRYQNIDPLEELAGNQSSIEKAGLNLHDLETFLQIPNANILVGRVLYPRYYKMNQGEFLGAFYPYNTLGFPRTAFKLIGPTGEYSIVLPGDVPEHLSHTSDVLVLGCNGVNYFDAVAVIVLDDAGAAYERKPVSPLQCPLQQPVCNNNSVCR